MYRGLQITIPARVRVRDGRDPPPSIIEPVASHIIG